MKALVAIGFAALLTLAFPTFSAADPDGPRQTSSFAPPAGVVPASGIEGVLELRPKLPATSFRVIRDDYRLAGEARTLPPLRVTLVQKGAAVIPVERGPVRGEHPSWEWLVEPGTSWLDPANPNLGRVVLPVALMERNANCIHNGHLAVSIAGGAVVSAEVQIGSETCRYFQFDMWTAVPAAFTPGTPEGADRVRASYDLEVKARLPVRPIEALAADYPQVDVAALRAAAGTDAVWGLVAGGVHYAAPCPTRQGPDPFCDVRVLPSYSTAKSIVAATALMRLEALSPGASSRKIADHVPACRAAQSWGDVSLLQALDMSTGHFHASGYFADEDAKAIESFFVPESHAARIAFACGQYPRKAAPGTRWVYHTTDTYLLGTAMQDVARQVIGPDADLYDDLVRPLFRAVGTSPLLETTRRSRDGARQPFTGWGLVYHRDDILRVARHLSSGAARETLNPGLLDAAMQRSTPGAGHEIGFPGFRYLHGFWARDVGALAGCKSPVWAPFMSGYGGISVVMFPNDVTYYRFGDDDHYEWTEAARQAGRIRSPCP